MKKNIVIFFGIIVILFILVFSLNLTGFITLNNNFNKETIKIGGLFSLTGSASEYGLSDLRGALLAIKHLNQDKSRKIKIELIYQDTESNPLSAVNAYQNISLKHKEIPFFVGGITTGEILAVAPITTNDKKVLISTMAGGKDIKHLGEYVFRNRPDAKYYAYDVAEYAISKKYKNIAILSTDTANAKDYSSFFKERFEELGGHILIFEIVSEDSKDYKTELLKIKSLAPDAIYLSGYYTSLGQMLKQIKELNISAHLLSTVAIEERGTIDIAKDATEGVVFASSSFDIESMEENVIYFIEEYQKEYGILPSQWSANNYDAVMIAVYCIDNYGYSSLEIKECFNNLDGFKGVSGKITFDQDGDIKIPLLLKTIKNGVFVRLS